MMETSWVDTVAKILGAPTALIAVAVLVWWVKDKIALKSDIDKERERNDKIHQNTTEAVQGNHSVIMKEIRDLRLDSKEEMRLFRMAAESNKDAVHKNTVAVAVLTEKLEKMGE